MTEPTPPSETVERSGVTRRQMVVGAGVSALAGAAIGVGATVAVEHRRDSSHGADGDVVDLSEQYDFYTGSHQGGIDTPPQRHTLFMTFDIAPGVTKQGLQVLLARWSAGIAQLMAGLPVGAVARTNPHSSPGDTGEAYGLAPSSLTVTLGLGPGVFDDRFGLAAFKPRHLDPLPDLPSGIDLDPSLTGGDLSLQACADDPQVAYHAIRDLARIGRGTVTTRWTVMGFGRASAGAGQSTPRNLLGFKDGTRNISTAADYDQFVWVDDDQPWLKGATYQVARKIQQHIEIWDADQISDQEKIFARSKGTGAPLTGTKEFDTPDFHKMGGDGRPVIDPTSHIALAAHENNGGVKIHRRSYNYTDGISEVGQLDAGLLFLAYMKDPAQFIQLQTKLGSSDLLNEYIKHIGSALFVVPPAPRQGHYIGEALFA